MLIAKVLEEGLSHLRDKNAFVNVLNRRGRVGSVTHCRVGQEESEVVITKPASLELELELLGALGIFPRLLACRLLLSLSLPRRPRVRRPCEEDQDLEARRENQGVEKELGGIVDLADGRHLGCNSDAF